MTKTVEDLLYDVEVAIEETLADQEPDSELSGDSIAMDMAVAVAWDAPIHVASEFFRRYLGYIPQDYARHKGIPAHDFLGY